MVTIHDLRSAMQLSKPRPSHSAPALTNGVGPTPDLATSRGQLLASIVARGEPGGQGRTQAIAKLEKQKGLTNGYGHVMEAPPGGGGDAPGPPGPLGSGGVMSLLHDMRSSVKRYSMASSVGSEHGYGTEEWE